MVQILEVEREKLLGGLTVGPIPKRKSFNLYAVELMFPI